MKTKKGKDFYRQRHIGSNDTPETGNVCGNVSTKVNIFAFRVAFREYVLYLHKKNLKSSELKKIKINK